MSVQVYLRNERYERVGEIDDFQSITFTRKWRGVGSFTMSMPTDVDISRFMTPQSGIIVFEDGKYVFSGPFTSFKTTKNADNKTFELSGTDDNVWLQRRYAIPCFPVYVPLASGLTGQIAQYGSSAYDERQGPAEIVIKGYVSFNLAQGREAEFLGPGGPYERKILMEVAPARGAGADVLGSARFDQLDELTDSLALLGGDLGWSVQQWVDGHPPAQLIFEVHNKRFVPETVKFSVPLGTLATFEYQLQSPDANYLVVGGQGELTARDFVEGGDQASIDTWGRIEGKLQDRRDTELPNELSQTLDEELSKQTEKVAASFEVSDTERQRYGKDWFLGDVVTVVINDVEIYEAVREATVTYSVGEPRKVSVVVGSAETLAPSVPKLFAAQRNALRRTSALERRL